MGNRAVISFSKAPNAPSLYFHWQGGRDSIEGFLQAAIDLGYHHVGSQKADMDQLETFFRPFFAEKTRCMSIYRQPVSQADKDNGDNGWYLIDPITLEIVGREFKRYGEQIDQEKKKYVHDTVVLENSRPACRYEFASLTK